MNPSNWPNVATVPGIRVYCTLVRQVPVPVPLAEAVPSSVTCSVLH